MIIQCNSCQKSFNVPDSAITTTGRLVQCSACGNKWTQYPVATDNKPKQVSIAQKITKKTTQPKKPKSIKKSKKKIAEAYSVEYLQKKHGLKIIDPSSNLDRKSKINNSKKKSGEAGLSFYNFLLIFIIFIITIIGVLNLSKDNIITYYPELEPSINYFYDTLNYFKIIIIDIISSY